jgi:uncharacterized repeat protein (TIGR01451 family)
MPAFRLFSFSSKLSRCFERTSYTTIAVILLSAIFATPISAASNPVPFVDIVSPVSITPGATGVTLTVRGTGFVGTSTVVWNGTTLATTFVSNTELTAAVPDAFVAAVGLGSVVVVSPTPGGGKSIATFIPVAAHESATAFPATATSSINVGHLPQGIVTADFNGDGKLDLAVANDTDSTVSILLGNGDGTFTTKSTPAVGDGTKWIAVGDFNEDGILDIAITSFNSVGPAGVSILLGNGDGTFALGSSPATGDGPFALIAGDFNGDGHLDLAVSNSADNTVTILLGVGNGTFTNGGTLAVGPNPLQIVAGDFNEDGNLDLAVSNDTDGTVSVLLGDGGGGFATQAVFSTGDCGSGEPLGLIAADFDGDGHLDLAAVNLNDVAILLGNGGGSFTLQANVNPTGGTSTVLIAGVTGDYNGDGILDLVVSDSAGGQAFLLPGTGGGNFGAASTYTTAAGAFGLATADFNGDGGLDLAIANGTANTVSIFLQSLPVTLSPSSLTFGNQNVSTSSASQAVTLTNHTGTTLVFAGISITGPDSGEFTQTHDCGAILTNFNICTIQVTFSPTTAGPASATLTIADNGSNSPQTLALSGTGVSPVPPSIAKSFSPTTVAVNTPSTVTFSITNGGGGAIDASFTDSLPSGLVVATTPGVTNACGGTVTATAAASSISFTNATFAVGTCAITVNVQSATDGVYSNSVTIDSTAAGNGNTSSVNLTVINPPTIAKAFGAATIPLNGTTSLTFTVSNSNTSLSANGIAFTDTLPAGLVSATPTGLASTCTGSATATNGSSSVALTGSSLAGGASCTVSLNVTGTTVGAKNNSVQVSSTNAGTGNTSNASVTVTGPPVIIKAFGAATIPLNGATSLSFTIQNNNTTQSLSGVAFADTLPAGLAISTPNGLTGTCGSGTITATQGAGVISLSGGTLAASSSCNFAVNVTGVSAGAQNNTSGAVTSTEGGTGGTASASVAVVAPPSIGKAFNPTTIALNGTTTLTFTVSNPVANTVAESGVAFSDTLPTGLVVATPNGLTNNCGGTATATAGSTSISLTGGGLGVPSGVCTVHVNVTGTTSGAYTNTSGAVSSTNGGTGNTASANLTVTIPPAITKAFGASTIALNATTSLTFTVTNPNAGVAFTGVAFTDNFPAGLVVATPNNLSSTCGGTSTAVAGSSQASLTGGTLVVSGSCTVSLNVQGTTAGAKNNSVQVSSVEGGTGNTSNASLTVTAPAVIVKAFGAASIPLNGSTSLSFTIQNNNTVQSLSGVGFIDTLPAGLVVSTPNGLTGSCGGGTITATQGTGAISLSGATLASSSSCNFGVNVAGVLAGAQNNTTGAVISTEGGTGGTASANLVVVAPPSLAKAFGAAAIPLNGTTSLIITASNPTANTVAEAGVAFADTLPAGIVVATPNGLTNTCGGTATATAGSGSISLTGGTIATSSTCAVHINVTGTTSGQFTNTTGAVSSANGGTGNTATANLTVASPPSIAKAFGAATIPSNGTTSLTFSLTNPNTSAALSGLAFTDSLPAGLVVATPSNLSSTCGGTSTAVAGSSQASLTGGTLAASGSCTFSLSVQGTTAGVKNNSVQVSSTEGGTGNTSNASVTVTAPPVMIKAFGAASIPVNGTTSLSFTIQNNNPTQSLSGVGFTDNLPAGLVISSPNGLAGTCGGGTIAATPATGLISLTGATLASSSSCAFSVNVTGVAAGLQNNTTSVVSSTEGGPGGTASANVAVVAPAAIAKAFNPAAIALGATSSLTFTITNPPTNTVAQAGAAFTDTLPTGLTLASSSATVCGGTLTTTAPAGIALAGAAIAINGQCQFSVTVTGAVSGQYTNTTGSVSSTNGGTGNVATANLSVASPPTITKAFGAAKIALNASTPLTFTVSSPGANTVPLTGLAFTDTLPAGLQVSTPNGLTGSCGGGTIAAAAGSSAITLAGASLAPGGSCAFAVNVTGTVVGSQNNSVTVTSANAGAGNTSTASVTIVAPPTIQKSFGAASIALGGSTSLTFAINNPNAASSVTGIGFTDTLPAGLAVSTPNGLTGTCGGGTITSTAGSGSVSLVGATLAASASCTFAVNVMAIAGGAQNNVTSAIASTEGGSGLTAAASLTVVTADLTITKSHAGDFKQGQTGATYSITVSNQGSAATVGTVSVVDNLPSSLTAAAFVGTGWTCTLTSLTCTRIDALGIGASYPPLTLTVNVSGIAPASVTNTAIVSGGGEIITSNDSASDVTTVDVVPPDFSIAITPATSTVKAGMQADYTITLTPLNNVPVSSPIQLSVTGVPANTSSVFRPAAVTPGSNAATSTFLISTTSADPFLVENIGTRQLPRYATWLPFAGLPLIGFLLSGVGIRKRYRGKTGVAWLCFAIGLACCGLGLYGCASAGNFRKLGTPTGTYTVVVTGTLGGVQHSATVSLTVQP